MHDFLLLHFVDAQPLGNGQVLVMTEIQLHARHMTCMN